MAFATGVATTPDDLIDQLCSFAVANAGFTNQANVTSSAGSGSKTIRRISKGGTWFNFFRFTNSRGFSAVMGSSGIAAGSAVTEPIGGDKQNYSTPFGTWAFSGPYVGHYFFTDGTCVHAVVEIASGIFNHFSFGKITPMGGFSGGEYVTGGFYPGLTSGNYYSWDSAQHIRPFNDSSQGSYSASTAGYIRLANAGLSSDFGALLGANGNSHGMFVGIDSGQNYGPCSIWARAVRDAPNMATNRTPMFPGLVRVYDSVSGLKRLAGSVPYVAFMEMAPDMTAKDIIYTDWQIFPITMRSGGNITVAPNSGEFALAYRRVA